MSGPAKRGEPAAGMPDREVCRLGAELGARVEQVLLRTAASGEQAASWSAARTSSAALDPAAGGK